MFSHICEKELAAWTKGTEIHQNFTSNMYELSFFTSMYKFLGLLEYQVKNSRPVTTGNWILHE